MGLIQKDDITEIKKCMTAGKATTAIDYETVMSVEEFEKGDAKHIIEGVMTMGKLIWTLPYEFKGCEGIEGDLKRIEEWGMIFKEPKKFKEALTKNMKANYKQIAKDT